VGAEAAVRAWVETWLRAWPEGDVDGIVGLYAEGARYASHPFREPETARSYVERAFGEEKLDRAWFGEPVVAGDRAAVEYWAVLTSSGGDVTIAGAALLRFGADERVLEHRDYWDQVDGRREPPSSWGR
jgi:ketosteroid isomerase-like protein